MSCSVLFGCKCAHHFLKQRCYSCEMLHAFSLEHHEKSYFVHFVRTA